MSGVNLRGLTVSECSYRRARKIVDNKPWGRKTVGDVLASLRKMKPGWNISSSSNNWDEGFRNIEIDVDVLKRMAEDPETMVRYKALILDLEDVVPKLEEWAEQNEGKALDFGIYLDQNGILKAKGIVRTLMGGEISTVFELPDNRPTWTELIQQKLESLREGRVEDAAGKKSWMV